MNDADLIKDISGWLADYADYGVRATEDQDGFVDGDVDDKRAELVAALERMEAKSDAGWEYERKQALRAEAVEAERDRWRAVACNVKDGTAAAEARVQQLKAALTRVAASGPCSSGCADFARAALADLEDTP